MSNNKVKDQASYELVQQLLEVEAGLSDWEVSFAESIVRQLEDGLVLTDKQKAKLEDVLDRLNSDGSEDAFEYED